MPLLQREGGKGYMCVWEGQDWFGIDIRQVGIVCHDGSAPDDNPLPDLKSGGEEDVPVES